MKRSALLALVAAATLLVAPALAQNEATQPLYQLHGSGTSNPAPIIWRVMDIMMARTKPRVAMSYRSVGSGSGAADFGAGANAFGCGDVPLPNATYTAMTQAQGQTVLHVPFLIGSVSVFHNVPGIGEGLVLPPCTLARIMRGDITAWNHPDILANNTHLPGLATVTAPIRIVHRNNGSSSTYAITHYFNRACPSEWSNVAGSDPAAPRTAAVASSRSVGVTTEWPADTPGRWQTVQNSQEMVEQISGVPFSLGYVESGQGLNAGLSEVALRNANGTYLVSADADVAPPAFIAEQFPLANLSSPDWVRVNPVYASRGNPRQWPLVLGTYLYVRANATFLGDAGGLLQLFLNYMLGADVAALMPQYFFVPFSPADRATILSGISSALSLDPSSSVAWRYEASTNNTFGQQNYVFSARRDSYLTSTLAGLATDVADAKKTLMLGDAYQVHGSGSWVSAALLRRAMGVLQSRARVPVSMTYRAVGSAQAIAEYSDYASMFHSYNHFKVADMPLPTSTYNALNGDAAARTSIGATVQIPFAVAALGLFYNKALPTPALALSCRLVARAYTGDLATWADTELVAANNFSSAAATTFLDAQLVVFAMDGAAGPTWALTGWLAASCSDVWKKNQTASPNWAPQVFTSYVAPGTNNNKRIPIRTPEDMAAALASAPGSLGYLPAALGRSAGLSEAGLVTGGAGSRPVRSVDANLTAVIDKARTAANGLFSDATADVMAALTSGGGGGLYGQSGYAGSWPLPMVQYMLMYRNLAGYGYSGPLLRAFAEFLLSSEGAALAAAAGLAPLPADVNAAARADLAKATLKTLTVVWAAEGEGAYDDTGSGLYTFSANRDSYESAAIAELQAQVSDLQSQLAAALPTPLRLACASGLMPLTRLLRNDVSAIATSPVRFTDEVINATSSAASELLAAQHEGGAAPAHLVLTPGPLAAGAWRQVARQLPVVQMPAALRPVALVYRGLSGLRLSACTVAKVLRGDVSAWNAQPIKDDNPGRVLPANPIRLVTAGPDDADARAVLAWATDPALVGSSCGVSLAQVAVPAGGAVADTSRIVAEVAAGSLYSGLGFVAVSELAAAPALSGINAAALPSLVSNTYIRPNQTGALRDASACPASGCGGAVAAAYAAALDEVLAAAPAAALGLPAAAGGDWSNFTARPQGVKPTTDVYPIFRLDFYAAPADLVHFGASGEAARGLLAYGLSAGLAARINAGLGPAWAGLGPQARQRLTAAALAAVQTAAADGAKWAVVATSASTAPSSSASSPAALVLSRLPPLTDSALPSSDAAVALAASGSGGGDVSGTAYQAAAEAVRNAWDKAVLAYDIAVAALVLACVLSVASLALAAWALRKVRAVEGAAASGGGGGGGGCFTPAAAKYEKHMDVAHPPAAAGGAATTSVEMGAYDKI
ncbi:hypothetical protein HYH02_002600 [Chlamydomonas schloesseri]|uniref:PBP domain-containing protein n=1 Tax=Chlamydomonas schloesseri TaxID=2026947 RepID=A0A836BB60_9CHLO|nr:hypothetical protein HYH02_002600 [Chlamydomonas schloesseri]|eukprot:KAG2453277.1 hypothetical protein HYH02_002600 [Chlamydomonas schloesseri]